MIAKMKKVTFLAYYKEYDAFLNNIRNLGVVHIAEKQQGVLDNQALQEQIRLSSRLAAAVKYEESLSYVPLKSRKIYEPTLENGLEGLSKYETLVADRNRTQQELQAFEKEFAVIEPWGNFKLERIQQLHDAGFEVRFFICSENKYKKEWEEKYNALEINHLSSKIYFITITPNAEEVDIDAEPVKCPTHSYEYAQYWKIEKELDLEDNRCNFEDLAEQYLDAMKAAYKETMRSIELSKVMLNTEKTAGEKLMLLQGWIPAEKTPDLLTFLDKQQVYYEVQEPTPQDNVPILLNNKGWFAWFEPICKLYMLPKYNELDLTPFFAPFFMLFFGLCLGDSGYGLFLFLGVTGYRLFAKNIGSTMKPILSLVQLLAISTFFCGMLTGNFFGANFYNLDWPFIQRMKSAIAMDNNDMFRLSLILGVVQILFGMILKCVNQAIQFGFKYAVGTIGWVLLLLSMAFAVLFPSILPMGGGIHMVILIICGLMIFLYNSPDKNIFINFGLGLWDSYNMVTGLLGDVLSYVRLFALGLSGGILASVFNSLAVGMKPDNIIAGPIVMVLIFVLGHSINIFMNVLGAMVHPMRLTFVEFFKNSGYEGGGKEYKPFSN